METDLKTATPTQHDTEGTSSGTPASSSKLPPSGVIAVDAPRSVRPFGANDFLSKPVELSVLFLLGGGLAAAGFYFLTRIQDNLEKLEAGRIEVRAELRNQNSDIQSLNRSVEALGDKTEKLLTEVAEYRGERRQLARGEQ